MNLDVSNALSDCGLQAWADQIATKLGLQHLEDFTVLQYEDLAVAALPPVQTRKLWKYCEFRQAMSQHGHRQPTTPDNAAIPLPATPPECRIPLPSPQQQLPVVAAELSPRRRSGRQSVALPKPKAKRARVAFEHDEPAGRFVDAPGFEVPRDAKKALQYAISKWEEKDDKFTTAPKFRSSLLLESSNAYTSNTQNTNALTRCASLSQFALREVPENAN